MQTVQQSLVVRAPAARAPRCTRVASVGPLRAAARPQRAARGVQRTHKAAVFASTMSEQKQQFEESERRWQSQVREGRIKSVSTAEAKQMMADGWTLLDVRPPSEVELAKVKGATCVPIFVVDDDTSLAGLMKQATAFGMGGWWLGGQHMKPNSDFYPTVQSQVTKDTKVVVACQKGLRSLMACEQMVKLGYTQIAWLNGGFDASTKLEWDCEEGKDVRMAGIGGVSSILGWTEPQLDGSSKLGGFENVIKFVGIFMAVDALYFGYQMAPLFMQK